MVGFPAAQLLAEAARSHWPLGGLPLGGVALGQLDGPFTSVVPVAGALLLVFLTAATGAALADWRRSRGQLRVVVPFAAVAAVAVGFAAPSPPAADVDGLRVAIVQGGGPRGVPAIQSEAGAATDRHFGASQGILEPLDLVLWPEDVVDVEGPVAATVAGQRLRSLARSLKATLVVGVIEGAGPRRFRNAAIAFAPDGQVAGRYDKVRRVPFGEYIPARRLLSRLADLSRVPRDALAGDGPGLLVTPAGRLGVMISYEVFFADRARAAVRAGGEVLLVPTNAASFTGRQVPAQQIAAVRLRALETRRFVLQAGPTGYSALVDPGGRVLARTDLGAQAVLAGTVGRRNDRTLYVRFGDVPALAFGGALLALAWGVDRHRPVAATVARR